MKRKKGPKRQSKLWNQYPALSYHGDSEDDAVSQVVIRNGGNPHCYVCRHYASDSIVEGDKIKPRLVVVGGKTYIAPWCNFHKRPVREYLSDGRYLASVICEQWNGPLRHPVDADFRESMQMAAKLPIIPLTN